MKLVCYITLFSIFTISVFNQINAQAKAGNSTQEANFNINYPTRGSNADATGKAQTEIGQLAITEQIITIPNTTVGNPQKAANGDLMYPVYAIISPSNGSAVSQVGGLVSSLYGEKPTSTKYYVDQTIAKINPVKKVEAQSTFSGASALNPIFGLWALFRDLAFIFYMFVFIILAFMILFRNKLGNGAYVTVVSSLPNIILSLILVVFSYPIGALMLDFANIITYSIAFFLVERNLLPGAQNIVTALATPGKDGTNILWIMVKYFSEGITVNGAAGNGTYFLSDVVIAITAPLEALGTLGWVASAGMKAILPFLLAITILGGIFRMFISLLSNYVEYIMKVVFSPFTLLDVAFKGMKAFTAWIKDLLSNVLVFPGIFIGMAMIALLLFGGTGTTCAGKPLDAAGTAQATGLLASESICKIWTGGKANTQQNMGSISFIPVPIGYFNANKDGTFTQGNKINAMIALGIMIFLPNLADVIKNSVKNGAFAVKDEQIRQAFSQIPFIGGAFAGGGK